MHRLSDEGLSVAAMYEGTGLDLQGEGAAQEFRPAPFRAYALADGEVPRALPLPPKATPFFFMPIPLNRTDRATLTVVPGIGQQLANAIVEYREQHGPFQKIEELLAVDGIGEKKLAVLKKHVSLY